MQDLIESAKQTRAWACYDCGKCTATCPIGRAGGKYSPRRHVVATASGDLSSLLQKDTMFKCLTCSLCETRCPVEIPYTDIVLRMREMAHTDGFEPECPHGGALLSVMRMLAKGGTKQDRRGWLTDELETEERTGEVFYWVGCTPYYDAFFPQFDLSILNSNRAAIQLMNKLGVKPVVSADEKCCGHDLLWNGDRENFEALARFNVKLVVESGAKTLITSCAECLRTWRTDYAPFLPEESTLKVLHITEFLVEHLKDLKFKSNGSRQITFQDPCRLGRHLGIYDPPRQLIAALPGVELVEMRRTKASAACCGGGTWTHCDRYAKRIQVERLMEARTTGVPMMATACPKCRIHFKCAMKDPNLKENIEIETCDITEIVAANSE